MQNNVTLTWIQKVYRRCRSDDSIESQRNLSEIQVTSIARRIRRKKTHHWVVVRNEPSGQFTAQFAGVPELQVTAATRELAVNAIRSLINDWMESGKLVAIELPKPNPVLHFTGHVDPNDPIEREFLEELARMKREDLELTLKEYEQEFQNSSSTSTT